MFHSGRMVCLCAVALALTTAGACAQSLGIDLGRTKPGETTTTAVDPGTYTVYAEPLDGPIQITNITSLLRVYPTSTVNTNFTTRFR